MSNHDLLLLAIYVGGGFLLGFLLYKFVIPLLTKLAAKTTLQSDDLIVSIIRKWTIPWMVALGVFIGLRRIDMADKYHNWLDKGLAIFYIFSITLIAARIAAGMIRIKSTGSDTVIPSSSIISNIVKVIIYCLGLVLILQSLGISVTPILATLGVGGLAVALALQDTLSNLFAGLQIIASGKINPGDFVRLDNNQDGFVQDITWRSTTISTAAGNIIIVPNSKLSNMIVTNFYLSERENNFSVEVSVSYQSDLQQVEYIARDVAIDTMKSVEGGVTDFEPLIRFHTFAESGINFRVIMRVQEYAQQFAAQHEFIKRLKERFRKEGIEIPFPVRTVYLKQ